MPTLQNVQHCKIHKHQGALLYKIIEIEKVCNLENIFENDSEFWCEMPDPGSTT
jgi:hypothetical protein